MLQEELGVRIDEKTLLFLDEIQTCPNAFASLRYFCEKQPKIPIIAAGSLLEFSLGQFQGPMPVGRVTYRWIGPLTFREFLVAKEKEFLLQAIQKFANGENKEISESAHNQLLKELGKYCCIGGMPEAMLRSLHATNPEDSILEASKVHDDILLSYRNDFYKYRGRLPVESLHAVLDAIPSIAGQTKVKYSHLSKEIRSASLKSAINALEKAGVISTVVASSANGVPISTGADPSVFKIQPLDIGLFVSQTFANSHTPRPSDHLFEKWSQGNVFETKWLGQIAEILVGQSFVHSLNVDRRLHYWVRKSKGAEAEIDFVTQFGTRVVPVEVKVGSSGTLRSLHVFMAQKECPLAVRFDINRPSDQDVSIDVSTTGGRMKRANYKLVNLPLYLADWMPEIVQKHM